MMHRHPTPIQLFCIFLWKFETWKSLVQIRSHRAFFSISYPSGLGSRLHR